MNRRWVAAAAATGVLLSVVAIVLLVFAFNTLSSLDDSASPQFVQALISGDQSEAVATFDSANRFPNAQDPIWLVVAAGDAEMVDLLIGELEYDPNTQIQGEFGFVQYLAGAQKGDRRPEQDRVALERWIELGGDPCVSNTSGDLAGVRTLDIVAENGFVRRPLPDWLKQIVQDNCE